MRISRLFVPQSLAAGTALALDVEGGHYLRSVLRLKPGDAVVLFNGEGGEFPAEIVQIGRDGVVVAVGECHPRDAESALRTHLGLGISRGERMDLGIQKAVELGVSAITPLLTERCVVRLSADKAEQRLRHWQQVARSACEQCGRNRLPEIHPPVLLYPWLECQQGLRFILHPHGGVALRDLPLPTGPVCLLSGPEGGFSDRERDDALRLGFTPLRLGPRILRTETAALAALAAIQTLWGDLGG